MALELMIRHGLDGGTKLVTSHIQTFASSVTGDFVSRPRIDREIAENHYFRIEEEEDFIEPVDDQRRLVSAAGLKETLLDRTEVRGVGQNAHHALRSRDERLFPCRALSAHTDIGRMFK